MPAAAGRRGAGGHGLAAVLGSPAGSAPGFSRMRRVAGRDPATDHVVMSYWAVRVDAVVTAGVDVDERRIEPSDVVEEAMPDLLRDPMALGHGLVTVDRDGEGRLERVPEPAQADGPDRLDPRDRSGGQLDLVDELGLHRVHQPSQHL